MDPPTAEFWMRSFDHRLDQILTVDLGPTDGDPDQRISSLSRAYQVPTPVLVI